MNTKGSNMEWLKKHADTVIILGAVASSVLWMNGKFNDIQNEVHCIEKDVAVIKTVLIMRNLMPSDMATCDPREK